MRVEFPLDHFGAAGSGLFNNLFNQSSNQRARRVAYNDIGRVVKAAGSVPRSADITATGILVNKGGVICIFIEYISNDKPVAGEFQ